MMLPCWRETFWTAVTTTTLTGIPQNVVIGREYSIVVEYFYCQECEAQVPCPPHIQIRVRYLHCTVPEHQRTIVEHKAETNRATEPQSVRISAVQHLYSSIPIQTMSFLVRLLILIRLFTFCSVPGAVGPFFLSLSRRSHIVIFVLYTMMIYDGYPESQCHMKWV